MSRQKGSKLSEEHKRKIVIGNKGKKRTKIQRKRMSEAQNNFYSTHKSSNIGRIRSKETKIKIGLASKGKHHSEETKLKISLAMRGENAPSWKGGITKLNCKIRHSFEYKKWRSNVFERDNWTCQTCNKRGCYLEAHHSPKSFSLILVENNIKSFEEAKKCKILWDVNNGVTLCRDCHDFTKRK